MNWNYTAVGDLAPRRDPATLPGTAFVSRAGHRRTDGTPSHRSLYWKKKRRRGPPYADYASWFRSPAFTDMILDRGNSIRELMSSELLESVMKSGSVRQIAPIASLAVFASLDGS